MQPEDIDLFTTEMQRLFHALSIAELTAERGATYWDALCDLSIESFQYACQHAARYFTPTKHEVFPVPGTLREYAREWRYEQAQQAQAQRIADAQHQLSEHTPATPDEGLAAIAAIQALLATKMDMREAGRPVFTPPQSPGASETPYVSQMTPAEIHARKMLLIRQAIHLTTPTVCDHEHVDTQGRCNDCGRAGLTAEEHARLMAHPTGEEA